MKNLFEITGIFAEEILDSRGNPTLNVTVKTANSSGTFSVPSGASTGRHEALEKRDGDKKRFRGLGVKKSIALASSIEKYLIGKDVRGQKEIDAILIKLDGTKNKQRLGANLTLGVSIACAKAAASALNIPVYKYLAGLLNAKPNIPYLYLNLINAGKHASSYLAFQEYMIVPLVNDVETALVMADRIKFELKQQVIKKYSTFSANYGDEGGLVIEARKVSEPLEILTDIIKKLKLNGKVALAIDAAASSFYKNGKYFVDGKKLSTKELSGLYQNLCKKFPILSIEDPFQEDDFTSFAELKKREPNVKIIGDDLTVTNPNRLKKAIEQNSISGIIIKPNQIGTLSETLGVMKLADAHKISCIVSHRSGETNDDFIADLAYAFGAFGLKAGATNRGERVAKYNRLWKISNKSY